MKPKKTEASASQPIVNGAVVYSITLPEDLDAKVRKMADDAHCLPHDVIVRLAVQGERCARLDHDGRLKP